MQNQSKTIYQVSNHIQLQLVKCFVFRYMNRRCQFLENFPGYNYNQGHGTNKADTRQLGSTLMNAMLKEVSRFCDQSTKENWSVEAHQQVCATHDYISSYIY